MLWDSSPIELKIILIKDAALNKMGDENVFF